MKKNHFTRRLLSGFVAACMLMTVPSGTAFAASEETKVVWTADENSDLGPAESMESEAKWVTGGNSDAAKTAGTEIDASETTMTESDTTGTAGTEIDAAGTTSTESDAAGTADTDSDAAETTMTESDAATAPTESDETNKSAGLESGADPTASKESDANWTAVEETESAVVYSGNWITTNEGGQSGGHAKQTNSAGATAAFTFQGTGVRWISQVDPTYTTPAKVYLDGELMKTVSSYDADTNYYQRVIYSLVGIPDAQHTIKIECQGSTYIEVDGFAFTADTSSVQADKIDVSPASLSLRKGDTQQMKVSAKSGISDIYGAEASFASENEAIATVDESGLVTGKDTGSTFITVAVNGLEPVKVPVEIAVEAQMRRVVDNEHPLIIHHMQREFNSNLPGTIQGGHNVKDFWDNLPERTKPYQALVIHGGYYMNNNYVVRGLTQEQFYRQQADLCNTYNIPFFLMIGNSYTSDVMSDALVEEFFQTYPSFLGVSYSECHMKNYADDVANKLEICNRYGGYIWYADQVLSAQFTNMLNTDTFVQAAKKYSKNLILMHKTSTPNSGNMGTNASEGVIEGAWLSGLADNWGTLTDSWMWYIDGYWKLYGGQGGGIASGGAEECRGPFAMPDQLFAYRMIQEGLSGATVFSFEHPVGAEGVRNTLSSTYTDIVDKATQFLLDAKIPDRNEVAAKTKVAITTEKGQVSSILNSAPIYNTLYGDTGAGGAYKSMVTKSTGRYGTIPVIPSLVTNEFKTKYEGKMDFINNDNSKALNSAQKVLEYFDNRYPETYTGNGYAEKLDNQWFTYNSLWETQGNQNVSLALDHGFADSVDISYDNFTYLVITDQADKTSVKFNNFLLDKDDVWNGYKNINDPNGTVHWDTDNNSMWPNYIWRSVIPNEFRLDETNRNASIAIHGLKEEPRIVVTDGMYDDYHKKNQYTISDGEWDGATGTYTFQISANGWVEFDVLPKTDGVVQETDLTLTNDSAVDFADLSEESPRIETADGSITGITLNMMEDFDFGQSFTLNANVWPTDTANKQVTWSSSAWGVATVAGGKVIARHPGTAVITAETANGIKKTVRVTVKDLPTKVTGVKFYKAQNGITGSVSPSDVRVKVDGTVALIADTIPAMAVNRKLIYKVEDPTLASVTPEGVVKGLKSGQTTVTATSVDGGFTDTCKLFVDAKAVQSKPVTALSISVTEAVMNMGEGMDITTATVPEDASLQRVVWSTEDEQIAEISDDGIVGRAMILAKGPGSTTIHGYTEDGGREAVIKVTVLEPKAAVDKTDLQKNIDAAEVLKANPLTDLVPATKEKFETALSNAWEIYNDTADSYTQQDVNDAASELVSRTQELSLAANREGLKAAVEEADRIIKSDEYVHDEMLKAYTALRDEAASLLAGPTVADTEYSKKMTALSEAKEKLTRKPVVSLELTALEQQIALAEQADLNRYLDLPEKKEFSNLLLAGKNLLENAKKPGTAVTQTEIDTAADSLSKARLNLKLKPSKTSLEALLKKAAAINLSNYTEASASSLKEAVNGAKAVMDHALAQEQDVKKAEKALSQAMSNLVLKENEEKAKIKDLKVHVKATLSSYKTIKLTWKKVSGVDGYQVQRRSGSKWITVKDLKNTYSSFSFTKGSLGKPYTLRVLGYKSFRDGRTYTQGNAVTKKAIPQKAAAKSTNRSSTSIKLSWKKINGVNGYVIMQKNGSRWKTLFDTKSSGTTSYLVTNLTPGKNYTFAVKAYKKNSKKKNIYGEYSALKIKAVPAAPRSISAKSSKGKVNIQWKKQTDVSGWRIQRKHGSKWITLSSKIGAKATTYTDGKVKKGSKYTYRLQSYKTGKGKVYSASSKEITVTAK